MSRPILPRVGAISGALFVVLLLAVATATAPR